MAEHASGSRHRLAYVPEVTYGTTPATPPFKLVRNSGTTLGLTKEEVESEEIRSDRQETCNRHGNRSVGGDINAELSYGNFDEFLQAVFCGTWSGGATKTATTISASAADNSISDSGNGFITAGFVVGDEITVTGFANAVNNATRVATIVAAGKITFGGTDGDSIINETAGASVTVSADQATLKTGTVRRSFTFERFFADITQYLRYTGVEFNTFNISVAPNQMVTMGFGVIGKDQSIAQTAISGSTYTDASAVCPFDSFNGTIKLNGTDIAVVTALELTLENGLETQFVIGNKTTLRPTIGRSKASGSITAYFEDATLLTAFQDETQCYLEFSLTDPAGNEYTFLIGNLKFNSGQPDVSGEGSITIPADFKATYDTVSQTNIQITRNPAP